MAAVLSPQLRIRPMERADLDRVGQIEVCTYPWPWSQGIFSDCLRIGYCCRVAEFDGTIDGYAILSTGAGEAHLLNLCVAPESRRAGLGRQLLEAMLVEAGLSGAGRLFLEVRPSNTAAIELYRKYHFRRIGRRPDYYPAEKGREDALVLVRHLDGTDV